MKSKDILPSDHKVAAIPPEPGRYRFPSGALYERLANGQIIGRKRKRTKAERKQFKKDLRAIREEEARLDAEQEVHNG